MWVRHRSAHQPSLLISDLLSSSLVVDEPPPFDIAAPSLSPAVPDCSSNTRSNSETLEDYRRNKYSIQATITKTQAGWLKETLISHGSRGWKVQDVAVIRPSFWGGPLPDPYMAVFSVTPHGRRDKGAFWDLISACIPA